MSIYDYSSFSLGYDPHFPGFNTHYSLGGVSRTQDAYVSFSLGDVLHAQGFKGLTEKGKKVAIINLSLSVGGAVLVALNITLLVILLMGIIKSRGGVIGTCYAVVCGVGVGPTLMVIGINSLHEDLKKEKAQKYLANYVIEEPPAEIPLQERRQLINNRG